jgi:hypothetical protein
VFLSSIRWSDRGSVSITFRYEENFCNVFVKHEAFSFSDYLASVGGLIGLTAGISVISLVEAFYHLILFLVSLRPSKKLFTRVHPETIQGATDNTGQLNQDHVLYQCSKYFHEFIKESSIHGLIYTTKQGEHALGRIFWFFFVILSALFCSVLIRENVIHAELNPITFEVDEKVWKLDEVTAKEACEQILMC